VKVLHERVAGIDVHKDMIKVAIRSPGEKPWTRKTEVFEFRTFYGVLQEMARELRRRGVTHVVMEVSGVYTEPVYHALAELDFTEVMVVNPAHVKALKGHKTDARDCARMAEFAGVRPAARLVYPVRGAKRGAGPDPVQDEDGPGPHLGDPATAQGAGVGRDQARLSAH
jgi:transposase